ncbi:plasmid mobilization protein [Thomasclavelia spiroformis]|uniref:plasmid mobilization protein n=1 Tax=Thomasclavelia spiroformis TaxID=29348 RepID=UPI0039955377
MPKKNNDFQGRFRNVVIGFRVSPEEKDVIDRLVVLSGLTRQDYLIRCTSNVNIVIEGNPYVYRSLQNELNTFIKLFKQIETLEEIELDDLTILKHVLEIVIAMHNKKIAQIKVQKELPAK